MGGSGYGGGGWWWAEAIVTTADFSGSEPGKWGQDQLSSWYLVEDINRPICSEQVWGER